MKKAIACLLSIWMIFTLSEFPVFAKESQEMQTAAYILTVDPNRVPDGKTVFSSIEAAKAYVRTLDKTHGDIIVEIMDGVYELENTLVFDETDSGTPEGRVRYVAAEGAHPVLSGGRTISGEWRDEGNGIFSIPLARDKKLRTLYVNGTRAFMTSKVVKGKGSAGEYAVEENAADWAWTGGTVHDGVLLPRDAIPVDTRNPEDIELMTQTRWNTTIVCVDSLKMRGFRLLASLQMPYAGIAQTLGWGNAYQFKENNMIYNVFEHLDEPGEFYFDKAGSRLYYCPREGEDLSDAQVVVPTLETLVRVEGKGLAARVHDISFEGLTFAFTDWNLHEVAGSHGRATNQGAAALTAFAEEDWHGYIYRAYDVGPAAVMLSSAAQITFTGNSVCHTGNDGLSLVNDVTDTMVTANAIYDTAGAALLIGHPQHMYIGDKGSDKGRHSEKEKYDASTEGACKNLSVENNLFKNTSRLFWGVAGVLVYAAEGLRFEHNNIENTTYSGLSLGWGWWNMNGDSDSVVPGEPSSTMRDNIIRYNKFVNTITTLSDAGAIYTIGDMPGTVISENYIDTIGSAFSNKAYHIRGIHIDEGTQHVYGEKNVIQIDPDYACIDCGDWGKKGNNTWDNNYSTAQSYTTTETYEPGTVITNAHYVPDAKWDAAAQAVIDNAGIAPAVYETFSEEARESEMSVMRAIPEYKPNIPLIVGASIAGAAVLASAVLFLIRRSRINAARAGSIR